MCEQFFLPQKRSPCHRKVPSVRWARLAVSASDSQRILYSTPCGPLRKGRGSLFQTDDKTMVKKPIAKAVSAVFRKSPTARNLPRLGDGNFTTDCHAFVRGSVK